MTHGNEPSGMAAYKHLLDTNIRKRLRCGKLLLVLNNLEAGRRFFSSNVSDEERQKARFLEVNMNRLPEQQEDWKDDERYEVRRAVQLAPIWQQFDVAMDIHSTKQDSPPMIVLGDNVPLHLMNGFPIDVMLADIHNVQIGLPAYAFYGSPARQIPVFEIEAGQDLEQASIARACRCAELFLHNTGSFELTSIAQKRTAPYLLYRMAGSVVAPDSSYSLTRAFRDFEFIHEGTVIAEGDGAPLVMPWDGHTIFGPHSTKILFLGEEVVFLSRPMMEIRGS